MSMATRLQKRCVVPRNIMSKQKQRVLQYCRSGSVVNTTPFGRDLRGFFMANLHLVLDEFRHGWVDGGCWTLAQAVKDWIGADAELWVVYKRDGDTRYFDHVAVRLFGDDVFIDGDGLCRGSNLVEKLRKLDQAGETLELAPFGNDEAAWDDGLCLYHHVWPRLSIVLRKRFGIWADMRWIVAEIVEIEVTDGASSLLVVA